MTDKGRVERRISDVDRRNGMPDRRRHFDVTWPLEKERRVAAQDRRQGPSDRRGV